MTRQKHLKALIRSRMAKTGERYSTARAHLMEALDSFELVPETEFIAHDGHCIAVRFTHDDTILLSGGFSGQARLWSTADWSPAGALEGHAASVNGFAVSADDRHVVTISSDKTVRSWNLASRSAAGILGSHRKQVVALDVAADGDTVLSGGFDGVVRLWSLGSGDAVSEIPVGQRVTALCCHPDDDLVAVGAIGPDVLLVRADGTEVTRLPAPGEATSSLAWSGDAGFLVAAGPGGVEIRSTDTWEVIRRIDHERSGMTPTAVSPDSSLVAMGWPHHVGVWRADGEDPADVVEGLPKGVYSLDFSHDGRRLALGCADGRVRVWRVGTTS